jgi:hypothetical protein
VIFLTDSKTCVYSIFVVLLGFCYFVMLILVCLNETRQTHNTGKISGKRPHEVVICNIKLNLSSGKF